MPLLLSIFCLHGYDDRSRFFTLSGVSFLAFILFSAIFANYFIVNLLFLLLLTSIITLTTIRRLRDAKLNKNWQFVPGMLFLITGIITLLIDNKVSYYLLLIPSLISALLLTYPSKRNGKEKNYTFGYYGPIDLSNYQQTSHSTVVHSQRIEPTLVSDGVSSHLVENNVMASQIGQRNEQQTQDNISAQEQIDIGELIRLKLLNNRKLQYGLVFSLFVLIIIIFITSLLTTDTGSAQIKAPESALTQQDAMQQSINQASNLLASKSQYLAMPDNFDLYLTPYQGILLHWQADEVTNGQLWSQFTTEGDKSCQVINFNKGNDFRPLTIEVDNNTDYFASFSPLDTQALIKALAFRGSFSLCGYKFSLKGTQAVLGKHNSYAPFLEE